MFNNKENRTRQSYTWNSYTAYDHIMADKVR